MNAPLRPRGSQQRIVGDSSKWQVFGLIPPRLQAFPEHINPVARYKDEALDRDTPQRDCNGFTPFSLLPRTMYEPNALQSYNLFLK